MKNVIGLLVFFVASSVYAGELTVKITSFNAAGNRTRAAEICGEVANMTKSSEIVKVTVDPKSKKPGFYNVIVGEEGRFCVSVVSFEGEATAMMFGAKKNVVSNIYKINK